MLPGYRSAWISHTLMISALEHGTHGKRYESLLFFAPPHYVTHTVDVCQCRHRNWQFTLLVLAVCM